MFGWVCFALIWAALSLRTYFTIPARDRYQFYAWVFGLALVLLLLSISLKKRVRYEIEGAPSDRLSQFHTQYRKMHQNEMKHLRFYWRVSIGAAMLGWALFLWGQVFERSVFTHPALVSLYFLLALLIGAKGVERGREVDQRLMDLVIKGARIEKKMKSKGMHYFEIFSKKRRMFIYLFRLFPILMIVVPLFKFGINPILFSRFSDPVIGYLVEIVPMTLTFFAIARYVFTPYWKFVSRYQKLVG